MKKQITLMIIAFTLIACSLDDFQTTTPSVVYPETNLTASFYTDGSAASPEVDWNGEQGSFSLNSNIEGLSINSVTGQITWTELLPPGEHTFSVSVGNSAGQTSTLFSITNPFEGYFEGTYNDTQYFAFNFSQDGSVTLEANNSSNPDTGSGTYTLDGDEMIANYMYENDPIKYSIKVTLNQTNTEAVLSGSWYFRYDAAADDEGGPVSLVLQ